MEGIRALLKEELGKVEDRLLFRIGGMERGFSDLKADIRDIERRVEKMEQKRITDKLTGWPAAN